ncbi:hypothetical protein G6L37_06395 [Agrobacterium rubi]|nr:hypothetical protein [Agrobacterium rubi]NTF24992.1 hypothetical protein [Agrobacterium rubi]
MKTVSASQHAAESHALNPDHLFFSAPFWKGWNHDRTVRDVRDECGPVRLTDQPIPLRMIYLQFARDAAWTDLPVVTSPRLNLRIDPASDIAKTGLTTEDAKARLAKQKVIAYDENTRYSRSGLPSPAYSRASFGMYCRSNFPDKPLVIRAHGKSAPMTHKYADITSEELISTAGGSVHLNWVYALNGALLMKPIMAEFVRPRSHGEDSVFKDEHILSRHVANFFLTFGHFPLYRHPLNLQIMFAVRDAVAEERRALYAWFNESSSVRLSLAGVYHDGTWIGSGKYQPLTVRREFENCMVALDGLGLIEADHSSKEVRLSSNALQMLARFHKANRDPDIISRFVTSGDRDISIGQTERIDDCLGRFFRKFKSFSGRD